jgi:hypothetical protein
MMLASGDMVAVEVKNSSGQQYFWAYINNDPVLWPGKKANTVQLPSQAHFLLTVIVKQGDGTTASVDLTNCKPPQYSDPIVGNDYRGSDWFDVN